MEFWIRMQQGRLVAIGFTTTGCGTSRAAGSMTAELAMGQTLETAEELDDLDVLDALGGLPAESRHCALLATNTLLAAIDDALAREVHGSAEI
jgi:nitrogen fixation NifU-like protein